MSKISIGSAVKITNNFSDFNIIMYYLFPVTDFEGVSQELFDIRKKNIKNRIFHVSRISTDEGEKRFYVIEVDSHYYFYENEIKLINDNIMKKYIKSICEK